jgi:hypothetical protein
MLNRRAAEVQRCRDTPMIGPVKRRVSVASRVLSLVVPLALLGGCTATVEMRPAAQGLAPNVDAVVGLPISIGWGGDTELRRIQRRTSDYLIAASGGRAVIAEELTMGEDEAAVTAALRGLGEDPARAITLALTVGQGGRLMPGVAPIPGFLVGNRIVVDYHAQIEVRRAGSKEVLGSVEAVASGMLNEPEVSPDGKKRAAMDAIDAALAKAIATFAPRLRAQDRPFSVVEIPLEASRSLARRLVALGTMYPELSMDDMEALAGSPERFLVVEPGVLVAFGLTRGDLLGVPGGQTAASRAALARAVARGIPPALAVERGGQRYMLASIR